MLYSTKRKWDKLMNNIATASTTNPSVNTASPAPTQSSKSAPASPADPKKRRTVETPNLTRPSIRAVSPAGSVHSTRSTVTTVSTLQSHSKSYATYSPWDRDAFLERLASFRFVDKWSAKPAAVNEVAWARRGWICSDKNRVRCNTCRKELLVKVESDDEQTGEGQAVVERYTGMIVAEHDDSCLWKKKGCDDTIYRLQLSNASISRPAFTARYNSLIKIRTKIPPSLSYPSTVEPAALHYPSECMNEGPIFETAAMLALFGWENQDPGIPSLVACSACFRRLGLWLFRKKQSENGQDEASVTRLDLIGEHRDYCPWVSKASQGKEPGWQTMLRVLQHRRKEASGGASVYSVATVATEHTTMTEAERDADDDSKLKKLRRLKTIYFGKRRKSNAKGKEKEKEKGKEKEKEKEGSTQPMTPRTPRTPMTPSAAD